MKVAEPIQNKKSTFSVWPTNAGQAMLFLQPATTGAMCCYLAGSDKSLNKFHDTGHIEWVWHAQTKICVSGWGGNMSLVPPGFLHLCLQHILCNQEMLQH